MNKTSFEITASDLDEHHAEDVRSIHARRFDEAARRQNDALWRVIAGDFLQRWIGPNDVVLDVGCGFGEFLNHIRCRRKIGVDQNPNSERSLDPGIEFLHTDATSLPMIRDESIDVVFSSHFMEHLPSKTAVEGMVREVRRVLVRGGSFIALGPNVRCIPGEYWDFWERHVPISDRSLTELLETNGFEVVDCHPRFLPYATRSALPKWPWLVRVYLRVPLAWRILGAQFLIRARRR